MLPNFLVIGAAKSGTTSLYHYLRGHPDVFMPSVKEIRFFSNNWARGTSWYEEHFRESKSALAIGEATPNYTRFPLQAQVPSRISKVIPDARLIYLLRDPVERMLSHYRHAVVDGQESRSVEQAIWDPRYFVTSCYAFQVEQYFEIFPPDQIMLVTSESLKRDRARTLQGVFQFIGVDPDRLPAGIDAEFNRTVEKTLGRRPLAKKMKQVPGYSALASISPRPVRALKQKLMLRHLDPPEAPMSEELKSKLKEALRPDVRRLRDYLDGDFEGWGIA